MGKTSLFEAMKDMETEVEVEASSGGFVGRGRTRSAIITLESQIDTCTKIVELGGGESVQVSELAPISTEFSPVAMWCTVPTAQALVRIDNIRRFRISLFTC